MHWSFPSLNMVSEIIVFTDVQVHIERLAIAVPSRRKNIFVERAVHTDGWISEIQQTKKNPPQNDKRSMLKIVKKKLFLRGSYLRRWIYCCQTRRCMRSRVAPWNSLEPTVTRYSYLESSFSLTCKFNYFVCSKLDKFKIHLKRNSYEERRLRCVSLRANIWMVPLSLEQQRNSESGLKLILLERRTKGYD